MNKEIKIRKYRGLDKVEIINLFKEFGSYLKSVDSLKRCIPQKKYGEFFLKEMLKSVRKKDGLILVAVVDKKIIGFIAGTIKKPDFKDIEGLPEKKGRIIELFITESYRREGIGKKLYEAMKKYFISKKCKAINIEVFAPNKIARRFYKDLGYIERNIDLVKLA